jgi:hypothetical protein
VTTIQYIQRKSDDRVFGSVLLLKPVDSTDDEYIELNKRTNQILRSRELTSFVNIFSYNSQNNENQITSTTHGMTNTETQSYPKKPIIINEPIIHTSRIQDNIYSTPQKEEVENNRTMPLYLQ